MDAASALKRLYEDKRERRSRFSLALEDRNAAGDWYD